ncbi:putative GST-like protein YibF [Oligella sp. MSHR50489EDL]|uniref:glutathione S-transferase n=1 Tax=Oligella sp. MSHR50489EDL TaxID=3139409 RepID=UPI003D812A08
MKIFYSAASPYVRKCLVAAEELGLTDKIELLNCAAHPINRDRNIIEHNPLGQVPTFFTDDNEVLFDSFVICSYLNELGNGKLLGDKKNYWLIMKNHSIADGLMNAALILRYETGVRPSELEWKDWTSGQFDKIRTAIAYFENNIDELEGGVNLVNITLACGLSYLDFRLGEFDWRKDAPKVAAFHKNFSERESMRKTQFKSM